MAVITSKSSSIPHQLSVEETKHILTSTAIATIHAIVSDNMMRMNGYHANVQLLDSGIFSLEKYYTILQNTQQQKRLDFFLKKGSFCHCYAPTSHFEMIPNQDEPTGFMYGFVLKKIANQQQLLHLCVKKSPYLMAQMFVKYLTTKPLEQFLEIANSICFLLQARQLL